jgi:D-proline dehydrogenase
VVVAGLSQAVVVGGGITGLFCAYYLAREGVSVTLIEEGELGEGSVHAAGLIEPTTFYQINNSKYLRDALSFARRGVLRFKSVNPRWLLSYIRHFGETLSPEDTELLGNMSEYSIAEYRRLGEEDSAWCYTQPGLLELYEEKRSFEAELDSLRARKGWRRVERDGYAGGVIFEDVGVVNTERFAQRMAKELVDSRVRVIHAKAERVNLDGEVEVAGGTLRPERTIVAAGIACRRLGVPITAVGGVGFRLSVEGGRRREERPIIVYERSLALAWFDEWVKITVGLEFGFSPPKPKTDSVLRYTQRFVGQARLIDSKWGFRPCSPDGLPVVGAKDAVVVATGGFRLGWSFAPAIARRAVDLALGRGNNHPRLSRYTRKLHSGTLT